MEARWLAALLNALTPAAFLRRPRTDGRDGRALGRAGERVAAGHLRRRGYKVVARNVRVRVGEADLICLAPDGETIVVVEVKTRVVTPGVDQPPPEAGVHAHKRRKLLAVTRWLARANGWSGRGRHARPVRIDVVAVEWPERGRPTVRHHVGAVTATGA